MIAVLVWCLAFFVFALELAMRLELSLRNYRRNSSGEFEADPTASRAFIARAVVLNALIKGLPTLIPVIVIIQFGVMGLRIGLFGALIGLAWQLFRLSGTVSQALAYWRTGSLIGSDSELGITRDF